jgi:hypothetical protein
LMAVRVLTARALHRVTIFTLTLPVPVALCPYPTLLENS